MLDHPFLRLDSPHRADMLADAAHVEVLRQGSAFVSLRSLATRMDMTPAALVHLFGGKQRMLEILTARYGQRWSDCFGPHLGWAGVLAALPSDQAELEGTTVWLALQALGRATPGVAALVADTREEERRRLARVLVVGTIPTQLAAERAQLLPPPPAPPPTEAGLDLLVAAIDGLRQQMTDATSPLPLDQARAALRIALSSVQPTAEQGQDEAS